jgi:hypothetical protein
MRGAIRRANAWIEAQPRRASIILGAGTALLFLPILIATGDHLAWDSARAIGWGLALGVMVYSSVTWRRR